MTSKELEIRNVGHFGFSGVRVDDLEIQDAATLFSLAVDGSASTFKFRQEMINGIKAIIEGSMKGPRNESILFQTIAFSNSTVEFHGIKPLEDCNVDDYDNVFKDVRGGSTALSAAAIRSIESVGNMGKEMIDDGYTTNGIVVLITDGAENASGQAIAPPGNEGVLVKKAIEDVRLQEKLESLKVIVIGVNVTDHYIKDEMERWRVSAGIPDEDMKVVGELTPDVWAKVVGFVSSSVTSTSVALGSGAPSKSLEF